MANTWMIHINNDTFKALKNNWMTWLSLQQSRDKSVSVIFRRWNGKEEEKTHQMRQLSGKAKDDQEEARGVVWNKTYHIAWAGETWAQANKLGSPRSEKHGVNVTAWCHFQTWLWYDVKCDVTGTCHRYLVPFELWSLLTFQSALQRSRIWPQLTSRAK
jgi:hypothetical protein